jgi:Bacterial Ig domain
MTQLLANPRALKLHTRSRLQTKMNALAKTAAIAAGLLCFSVLNTSAWAQSAGTFAYQIDIVGGTIAQPGTVIPITLYTQILSGTPADVNDNVALRFTDGASGQPLPYGGIDFTCPHPDGLNTTQCTGGYPNYHLGGYSSNVIDGYLTDSAPTWMNLIIAPTATLGTHTILITGTDFAGVVATRTWTINVLSAAQLALPHVPLAPAVPEPMRARWESDMIKWGQNWCPALNPQSFNTYLFESVMFYDGARVYYQIQDYTKDPSWAPCAHQVATDYYPYIANGAFFGMSMFPEGLVMDAQRTGTGSSYAGVAVLAQTSSWAYGNPQKMTDFTSLREDAYGLEALLDANTLNGTVAPLLPQAESALIGALDQIFIQKRFTWYEPFMVGLAAEALIKYNDQYPDPRIPYVLKKTLDSMWSTAWRADLHGFYYRCYSPGLPGLPADLPASNNGCFDPDVTPGNPDSNAYPWTPGDIFDYNDGQPNLNNLISPAYAWMYLQTGDTKYREEADSLFADDVIYNGAINWAGKEFSQNYRWSFDYIKWRDQANSQGASVPSSSQGATFGQSTQPPVIAVVAPASGTAVANIMSVVANASDNVHVTGVQFQADGVNLGPAVVNPPFEQVNIPTFLLSNGSHSITAIAYDAQGNSAISAPVTVTVNNPLNSSISQCPSNSIPTGVFFGCYFQYSGGNIWADVYNSNVANPPPAPTLGTLITTRTDTAIDFDWGGGNPAAGVIEWNSAEVWQSKQMFDAGTYTFTASVDGNTGIRVYVDGQMVRNQWAPNCGVATPQNNCPESFTLNFLQGGLRLIRVEAWHYFSSNSLYSVHLSWSQAGPIAQPVVAAGLVGSPLLITTGQPVTLTWTSTNADNSPLPIPNAINNSTGCFGTNFGIGSFSPLAGSVTVAPTATTTYSVECYGPAGAASAQATVVVSKGRH